ncbi:phage tail assembly chaperone [Blastomonas sp. CCH1-A6]|uniref:phage tail assembly chaperone n=1 Tax=Blastomonas sp. CCH1-A6 TaxID=1768762 RepID=UPI0008374485
MFKLVKERLVWWPVTVAIPADDGDVEEQSFSLKFRVRDVDGNRELLASAPAMTASDAGEKPLSETYAEFVEQLATDWKDVEAEKDGDKLAFNRSNLVQVMKVPGAFMAVLEAYRSCSLGEKATRAGN